MTGIIVQPDLGKVVVRREGIFTVDAELAALECNCPKQRGPCGGIDINKIPLRYRTFQMLVQDRARRFIARQLPRGFEWYGGDLELHGPWFSLDLAHNLQDASSTSWQVGKREKDGFEHPERAVAMVLEATPGLMDYLLVGEFLFQDQMTDLEIPA